MRRASYRDGCTCDDVYVALCPDVFDRGGDKKVRIVEEFELKEMILALVKLESLYY